MKGQVQANKICSSTWDRQAMNSHKQRLGAIKSHIDTQAPKVYPHLINRSKKEQMLEERYTQIEYENRILLKKMSRIMRTNSMDNLNYVKPKSLNSVVRKNELRKIMDENQKILSRIQSRRPYYNRKEWDNHEVNHSKYLTNLRDRPVKTLPLLNDKYARSHSAPPKRQALLAPIDDENGQHTIQNKKRGNKAATGRKGAGGAKGKKGSPKKKGGDRVEISKGGRSIDGQYVIVTVDEVLKPQHGLEFKSYDLDTSEHHECLVTFDTIKLLIDDEALLNNNEELANVLMSRLKFEGENLVFDDSPGPVPADASAEEQTAQTTAEPDAKAEAAPEKKMDESYGEGSFADEL